MISESIPIMGEVNAKGERTMMLDYYEEVLKDLEELEINLDKISPNDLRHTLRSIVNRGWLQIETMYGAKQNKKYSKEEIQENFNNLLKVIPMTRVKRTNDKT